MHDQAFGSPRSSLLCSTRSPGLGSLRASVASLREGPRSGARGRYAAIAAAALPLSAACGGQATPPAASPATSSSSAPRSSEPPSAAAATIAPVASSEVPQVGVASPDGVVYDTMKDPTDLKPLFEKTSMPAFPGATVGEQECWQTLAVKGVARDDYESITKQCGAATGSVEYVRPTVGQLHHKHDRRDTFVVPIVGGLCYRFFGVADSSIQDLDILIEQRGALVGDDKTVGPVAIIQSDKAWCMDRDGVYNFLVQVDGEGHGQYVFGVWARKK